MRNRLNIYAALLAIGLAAMIAAACGSLGESPPARTPVASDANTCLRPTCEEVRVVMGNVSINIPAQGQLRHETRADLSFGSSGRITAINVQAGQQVTTGQALASIDPSALELGILEARAALQASEKALAEVATPSSEDEIRRAEAAFAGAQVAVAVAQDRLRIAKAGPDAQAIAQARADVSAAEIAVLGARQEINALTNSRTDELARAEAEAAFQAAALNAAQKRLAELRGPVNPALLRSSADALAVAEADLKAAQDRLAILRSGPDPEVVRSARMEIESARQAFAAARADLESLKVSPPLRQDMLLAYDLDRQSAEFRVAAASLEVEAAQNALNTAMSGPTPQELAQAQAQVSAAELTANEARRAHAEMQSWPPDGELALAEREAAEIKVALEFATQQLATVRERPTLKTDDARNRLALAQEVLDAAVQRLAALESGPDNFAIWQREQELELAVDEMARLQEELRIAREGPSQLTIDLARASVEVARDNLLIAEERLRNSTIVAPFDGVLGRIDVREGQQVEEGLSVFQIVNTDTLEMTILLNATDVRSLRQGMAAEMTFAGVSSEVVPGIVTNISPLPEGGLQQGNTTYEVVISSEQLRVPDYREGMAGVAQIFIEHREGVLVLPSAALTYENRQSYVEVVDGSEVFLAPVSPGLNNGRTVEVQNGLSEGDLVRVRRDATNLLGTN